MTANRPDDPTNPTSHDEELDESGVPSSPSYDDSDPFEDLATEFSARIRKGERPSIEKYALAHPEIADEIRELFPTIAAMEQTKVRQLPPKRVQESLPMERLGDFRLLGEIGRGGMGIVYEAEQVSLGRRVAVKVLPKQALLDERHLQRFEREAQTAAKLHHTNIVPVFGVGQQDGYHYIVMQFIPGVGLDEVLLALRQQVFDDEDANVTLGGSSRAIHATQNARALLTGEFGDSTPLMFSSFQRETKPTAGPTQTIVRHPMTEAHSRTVEFSSSSQSASSSSSSTNSVATKSRRGNADGSEAAQLATLGKSFYDGIARIGVQVADALAYAHEQETLHRDIKPGNLLLDAGGTAWVADFGLAKLVEQDNVSRTGDVVGTLSYIPPESFSGEADARGDLYSLGLSLFELLTLKPAFHGRDRGKLVRDITEGNLPKLAKLNPGIPRDLETIVLKAVAQRPEDRYATAREMTEDLDCFLTDLPIKARRMSIPEQFARWCRRNKLVATLSAAVLSLLIVSTVQFGMATLRISQERDKVAEAWEEAKVQRDNAKDIAREALNSFIAIFRQFDPFRLPVSATDSMMIANSATSLEDVIPSIPGENFDSQDEPSSNQDDLESGSEDDPLVVLVAPPPVKSETAELLEGLLVKLDQLILRVDEDEELAPLSAKFTLHVAKTYKTLGQQERATKYFDDAIARYERLRKKVDLIPLATGLAICLNEKGDMLAQSRETYNEAEGLYRQSQELLQDRDDLDPRAKYELARAFFLISVRRGRAKGRMENWAAKQYLEDAIALLQPMVKTEANPEYRYLLARCYIGQGFANRGDEKARIRFVDKAIGELSKLVEQVDVADYQYEYAVANLLKANSTADHAIKRTALRDANELLDAVCSSHPNVSDYQIQRSRALEQYAGFLDATATRMETIEDDWLSYIDRVRSGEVAERAYQLYFSSKELAGDRFASGLRDSHLVALADVLSSFDQELAIEVYRDALVEYEDEIVQAQANLGLATSLNRTYVDSPSLVLRGVEAAQILQALTETLEERLDQEINGPVGWSARGFRPPRYLMTLTLLAKATYEQSWLRNEQRGLSDMEALIESYRKRRFDGRKHNESEAATFDLWLSQLYLDLELVDQGLEMRDRSLAALNSIFENKDSSVTARMSRGLAGAALLQYYRHVGDAENYDSVHAVMEAFPRRRPRGTLRPKSE